MRKLLLIVSVFLFASCRVERHPIVDGVMRGYKSRSQAIKAVGCSPCKLISTFIPGEPMIEYNDTTFFVHEFTPIDILNGESKGWYVHIISGKSVDSIKKSSYIKTM